jgi:hypothetical protein
MATEKDIVLIHVEDQPAGFARIESILPDAKKDWYHVTLLLLQVPVQTVTWILKNDYINGVEYTMGGNRMRLDLVESPVEPIPVNEDAGQETQQPSGGESGDAQVISFADRKK